MKQAAAEKLPDVALPNPECADRGAESAGQSAQIAHGGSEQDGKGGSGSTDGRKSRHQEGMSGIVHCLIRGKIRDTNALKL